MVLGLLISRILAIFKLNFELFFNSTIFFSFSEFNYLYWPSKPFHFLQMIYMAEHH